MLWQLVLRIFASHKKFGLFCRMDESDMTLDVSLNDSFSQATTSTPVSTKRTTHQQTANQLQPNALFKAPLPPPPPTPKRIAPAQRKQQIQPRPTPKVTTEAKRQRLKKDKPKLVCKDCGKDYVNMGFYKNHCRTHAILGTELFFLTTCWFPPHIVFYL